MEHENNFSNLINTDEKGEDFYNKDTFDEKVVEYEVDPIQEGFMIGYFDYMN